MFWNSWAPFWAPKSTPNRMEIDPKIVIFLITFWKGKNTKNGSSWDPRHRSSTVNMHTKMKFSYFHKLAILNDLGRFLAPFWEVLGVPNRHFWHHKFDQKNYQFLDRFYDDCGAILAPNLAPKTLPKSSQNRSKSLLGPNLAPKRAQEAPRPLPELPGDQLFTICCQFWDSCLMFFY